MSSPHVAGAVALLLEARPHTTPDEVQQRLQNNARPHQSPCDEERGMIALQKADRTRQPAGMGNPLRRFRPGPAVDAPGAPGNPGKPADSDSEDQEAQRDARHPDSEDRPRRRLDHAEHAPGGLRQWPASSGSRIDVGRTAAGCG